MKKSLLATVAAVALIAGAGIASAAEGAKDQPAMKGSAAAPIKSEPAMKQGADIKAGAGVKGKAETTGAGTESKSEMKAEPKANLKADTKSKPATTGAGASDKTEMKSSSDTKAKTGMDSKAATDNKAGATKAGAAADTKAGASGSVNLTADQKAKIRTTVLQSSSAPKVSRSSINFNISVGTVVPRSIHFVAVPPALVEIHPAWRGYSYFVVDEEIIIVDARTLKIIAIVAV